MSSTFLGMPATPPRSPYGTGNLRGDRKFPEAAHDELRNEQLRRNLGRATRTIRAKRLDVTGELPDWEALRDAGSAIKTDTMNRLPELLEQLERKVTERGGTVHWARDGVEANEIVARLVRATGSSDVIKVKSMATQEIGLNEHLESVGITPYETDLAELIVQLAHDKPSHILVPAIHRNRDEIRQIFLKEIPGVDPSLDNVPAHLAAAARAYLREKFMTTKVAVSGANFGIAETGTLAVVESEGNGRMCLTMPDTLITVMGIEKVLPRYQDLEVFLQLLPRSSTGERMNPYTSMWTGVTPGDGPQEFHLVLLDNGRTAALADRIGREALNCIRCSACLNVCPVYERAAWPRVRIDVPRTDRRGTHSAARRDARGQERPQQLAAVRLQPLRRLFRRLPGQDRHSLAPGRAAPPAHRAVRHHGGEAGHEGRGHRHEASEALHRRAEGGGDRPRPRRAGRQDLASPAAVRRLEREPGHRGAAEADLPLLAGIGRGRRDDAGRRGRVRAEPQETGGGEVTTARETVLGRIKDALSLAPAPAPDIAVPRGYRTGRTLPDDERLALFTDRLVDYKATVHTCTADRTAHVVAEVLRERGARRIGVAGRARRRLARRVRRRGPAGLRRHPGAPARRVGRRRHRLCRQLRRDRHHLPGRLAGPGTAGAFLVPDLHVCVVDLSTVEAGVPEAVARLVPQRPTTLISGPSATSDIELERVEGVHGPRTLAVVIRTDV